MSAFALPLDAMREILPDFVEESLDWMAQAETALLALETDASDAEAVNVVLRAFHTVKGTSAFLGLDVLSGLAHDAESLLIPVRDAGVPFTRTHADLLLAAADATRALLDHARDSVMGGAAEAPPAYTELRRCIQTASEAPAAADGGAVVADRRDGQPADPPDGTAEHRLTSNVDEEWTRVRTQRLDQLLDLVGELVVAQSMVAQDATVVAERHGALETKVLQTSKIVRELQSLGLGLRMVPMRSLFRRMQRLVRELSHRSGKPITLVTEGADTEIDRRMVEALVDPLVHMVRNAVDHGIEPVEERVTGGKPAEATLRLAARHAAGAVIIELQDDGRGLHRERILATARERGLITGDRELADEEVWPLIFAPGLSTSDGVTDLSGRGVGMDVVQRSIESLRGRIEIDATPGSGTAFTIRLPLTTAITDGLLVRVGAERYIVPSLNVVSSFRPAPGALVVAASVGSAGGSQGELVIVQERAVPVVRLHQQLGVAGAETDPSHAVLVVLEDGRDRFALLVDELLGQQQFVARPLTGGLRLACIAGSAVLGDGRVGLILDPGGLRQACA